MYAVALVPRGEILWMTEDEAFLSHGIDAPADGWYWANDTGIHGPYETIKATLRVGELT